MVPQGGRIWRARQPVQSGHSLCARARRDAEHAAVLRLVRRRRRRRATTTPRKKRDEVGARLDSKDLAAAKALAGAFRAKELTREANDPPAPKGGWESVKEPAAARPAPPPKPFVKPKVSQL